MATWLSLIRRRLSALTRRRQIEQDLQDEVVHLDMLERDLRQAGTRNARTVACRRFGGAARTREEMMEAWSLAPRMRSRMIPETLTREPDNHRRAAY